MPKSEDIDELFKNSEEHRFSLENSIDDNSRKIITKATDDLMSYFNTQTFEKYTYAFGKERVFNIQLKDRTFPVASISTTLLLNNESKSAIDVSNPLTGGVSPRYWSPSFSVNEKTKRTNTIWTDIKRVKLCPVPRVIFSYFTQDRVWLLECIRQSQNDHDFAKLGKIRKPIEEMNEEEQNQMLDNLLTIVTSAKNK